MKTLFLSVFLAPVFVWAVERPLVPCSAYREDDFNRLRVGKLREEIPVRLATCRRELADARELFGGFFGSARPVARERVGKRLEIAESLVAFVERNAARGDVSSVLFAEQGLEDLRKLGSYFKEEAACWRTNPESTYASPKILSGNDFGMRGDGVADNTAAFTAAAKALARLGGAPAILDIAPGTYRFGSLRKDCWQPAHISFERLTNVLVRGRSPDAVKFVFTDICGYGLVLFRCANVTVRGVEVQWEGALHSEGRVVEIDRAGKTLVVEHTVGTMRPDDPDFDRIGHSQACAQFRKDGSRVNAAHTILTDRRRKVSDLGGGRFRIPVDGSMFLGCFLNCEIGGFLQMPCRNNKVRALVALDSPFTTFEDIRVLNSPSAAFTGHGSAPSLSRCVIRPKAGMRISTNADGFMTDRGSYMAHCDFSGMLDDGHNPHSYGGYIAASDGTNLVYKSRNTYLRPHKGDLLTVMRPESGQFLANLRTASDSAWAGWKEEREYTKTAFEALPHDLRTYETIGSEAVSNAEQIQMVLGKVKPRPLPDQVYFPDMNGVGGVINDCRISHMRGKAFSIQSSNMLVENVTVEDVNCGIGVCALSDWTEGPLPYHVIVRNCALRNVKVGLRFEHRLCDRGDAFTAGIRGVSVSNVTFVGCADCLYLANVSDATLENVVAKGCRRPGCLKLSERIAFRSCTFNGETMNLEAPTNSKKK